MTVTRTVHIGQILTLLVFFMIVFNIYTLTLVTRVSTRNVQHQESGRRINELLRSSSNPRKHTWKATSSEQVGQTVTFDNTTSVRFLATGTSLILHIPKRLRQSKLNEIHEKILKRYNELNRERYIPSHGHVKVLARIQRALRGNLVFPKSGVGDYPNLLRASAEWPFNVDGYQFQKLGETLRAVRQSAVTSAKNSKKGTQLKIEVSLEGGNVALFKPKWHANDAIVTGEPYGGRDRHYGEIAAFYLNLLLGYNQAPITTGRKFHIRKDILNKADEKLASTFLNNDRGDLCLYGVCYFCTPKDFVCAENDVIEGALILFLQKKLRTVSNPWKRAYSRASETNVPWDTDPNFCQKLMKNGNPSKRLEAILDITAVSVFDFLIGNADRHRLELYANPADQQEVKSHSKSIILIDNGKSFGNPFEDYVDILAPLYQCCKIRRSLVNTLKKFRGVLGKSLDTISSFDALYPLVTSHHLNALDRRLIIILSTIQACLDRNPETDVIL